MKEWKDLRNEVKELAEKYAMSEGVKNPAILRYFIKGLLRHLDELNNTSEKKKKALLYSAEDHLNSLISQRNNKIRMLERELKQALKEKDYKKVEQITKELQELQ